MVVDQDEPLAESLRMPKYTPLWISRWIVLGPRLWVWLLLIVSLVAVASFPTDGSPAARVGVARRAKWRRVGLASESSGALGVATEPCAASAAVCAWCVAWDCWRA